ncbi:MAG: hypothetical protein K8H74_16975 [Notoacmeibacter sp.]|nr:hypothetical protein [Notoacmeibacter sp.]
MTGQKTFSFGAAMSLTVSALVALFAIAWAFRPSVDDMPYLKIAGGGFVYNYRLSEVFYGFTAQVARPLETGSIIEAAFEDPQGGPSHVVRQRVGTETDRYALRSPGIRGVQAGHSYRVAVRILDRQGEQELWRKTLRFKSQISDKMIAEKPLTIGPGYALNPAR